MEVRALLPTERIDEVDGRSEVTDVGMDGERYVTSWIDEVPDSPPEDPDVQQMFAEQDITAPAHHTSATQVATTPMFGERSTQPADVYQQQPRLDGAIQSSSNRFRVKNAFWGVLLGAM